MSDAAVVEKKIELRVIAPTMATDKSPYKFNQNVDMVIMRCVTGDMGILPGRMPVSMVLDNGVLRIFDADTETHIAIMGGVAHVSDDIVTILSDAAKKPDEINIGEVETELEEFRRLYEETPDYDEKLIYRKDIQRCQVLLEVAGNA